MMDVLLTSLAHAGSPGVHLGMYIRNTKAFHFYTKLGFHSVEEVEDVLYMGKVL